MQTVDAACHSLPFVSFVILQEYIDISGTRMSCCEHQSQADDGPTLPPFLQFSKRFMQFDLNMPTWGARVLDDLEDVSSQPNNIL